MKLIDLSHTIRFCWEQMCRLPVRAFAVVEQLS